MENKLKYSPTYCEKTGDNQGDYRFTIEQEGNKMIFIIGLNPSTANEKHIDPTMRKTIGFVERAGYNGFVMMNLCSQRQTKPDNLPQEQEYEFHEKALKIIKEIGLKYPNASVLLAFGNNIIKRKYLKNNLKDIIDVLGDREYLQIGHLTNKGYPRHPLYAKTTPLQSCDVDKFKKQFKYFKT